MELFIKRYNSNIEFLQGDNYFNFICDADSVNADIFDDLNDVINYVMDELTARDFILSPENIQKVKDVCVINLNARF